MRYQARANLAEYVFQEQWLDYTSHRASNHYANHGKEGAEVTMKKDLVVAHLLSLSDTHAFVCLRAKRSTLSSWKHSLKRVRAPVPGV